MDDPIKTLVYAAQGSDVHTDIVDGRLAVEGGKILGLDERSLIADATEAHIWQAHQFGIDTQKSMSVQP